MQLDIKGELSSFIPCHVRHHDNRLRKHTDYSRDRSFLGRRSYSTCLFGT